VRFIDHTPGRTPLNERSAGLIGRYLPNTQETEETYIYTLSGIRTLSPSIQVAADLRLRPHCHRDRPFKYSVVNPCKLD
jgi:hypothetical protein